MNKQVRTRIKGTVFTTLKNTPDLKFPVNIKNIVKNISNIRLISYSKHMKKFNLSYKEMLALSETEDAYTVYSARKNEYIIFYNDLDQMITSTDRYRWNIAHELGHVVLRHHIRNKKTKLFRNSLSAAEYKDLENEADCFASYILVPHAVLYYFVPRDYTNLRKLCRVSEAAAKIRIKEYNIWLQKKQQRDLWSSYDLGIRMLFYDSAFNKVCDVCGYYYNFIEFNNIDFCPICGSKALKQGDIGMKYREYETDSDGRLKKCIRCNNEKLIGDFCHICGAPVKNYCSDFYFAEDDYGTCRNSNPLPGNSRYCPACSTISMFYKAEILTDWTEELKRVEEEERHNAQIEQNTLSNSIFDGFMHFPDGIDEELPFKTNTIPDDIDEELPFN